MIMDLVVTDQKQNGCSVKLRVSKAKSQTNPPSWAGAIKTVNAKKYLPPEERLVGLRNLAWQKAQKLRAELIKEDG